MLIANIPSTIGRRENNPDNIIIHAMAEFIEGGAEDFFAPDWLTKLGLSAHYYVTPSGVILQQRLDQQSAYHAGPNWNNRSIGIEILVPGIHTYATFLDRIRDKWISDESTQFVSTLELAIRACQEWEIPPTRVYQHSYIDPGRKQDPGKGFPWKAFEQRLREGVTLQAED